MVTSKRIISDGSGDLIKVDYYEDKHRPERQEKVGLIYPLNPVLREYFSDTPNDHRERLEVADWWDLPYIESITWEQSEAWIRHSMRKSGEELDAVEIEARIEARKTSFFDLYPTGEQYVVSCLDGGAWDRPTRWGHFATLDEAIACCSAGPTWRQCRH